MMAQATCFIVVVAFSRADDDELVPTYDPAQFEPQKRLSAWPAM
jgi:hypothetical protein